ncbi:MAG TPA: glycosyltransferase family 2 protein [Gemmatimonadota bacterium]|nr:glycosyltransferase family 2 protein [Gemmatimonadota bacterium]
MPGDLNSQLVAVIVLTFNQCERSLRCMADVGAQEGAPFDLVLWDNGSGDGTAERVREAFPGVLVHSHPVNLGVASGRNAAAALAMERLAPSHLLFLDNDITPWPGFIRELLAPFDHDARLAQTQAKLLYTDDPKRLNDGGGHRVQFWLGRTTPVGYKEIDRGQHDRPAPCLPCGGAMMVRADVFRDLGGFDATFDPFGPEDLDFSLRVREAGWRALYVPTAVAYHEVTHTFGAGYSEDYARLKAQHWLRLLRRHASAWQQLGFVLLGGPLALGQMILREVRRGNVSAVRGVLQGAWELGRSRFRAHG